MLKMNRMPTLLLAACNEYYKREVSKDRIVHFGEMKWGRKDPGI
jgi:hypothetical protein